MIRVVDAATIARALPFAAAIGALEDALRGGLDPEAEPPRQVVPSGAGHFLVMPSSARAGVKVVAVAPRAWSRGSRDSTSPSIATRSRPARSSTARR